MGDEEDGYQEDFYENEMQQSFRQKEDVEEDDEQHAQKINGKLEALQRQVETVKQELEEERRMGLEVRKQYEKELKLAWAQQTKAEEESASSAKGETSSTIELEKYKRKCDLLEEKLEMALLTGSSNGDRVPNALEAAFHKYCDGLQVYAEHSDRILSVADCLKILQISEKKKKRSSISMEQTLSAPSTADGPRSSSLTVNRLSERVRNLEEELKIAEIAARDTDNLKNKVFQASERIRTEKEGKRQVQEELAQARKKVDMLTEHVEKLVLHIKREGAQKLRMAEASRALEKEMIKLKDKSDYIAKKSAAKDRLILELREGSKVLEDQLRLMDEKYLELRGKLDYARSIAAKKIRRAEKVAADLRVKFAMTGSPLVLDSIPMPGEFGGPHSGMSESGFGDEHHVGWGGMETGHSRSGMLPPKKSASNRSVFSKNRNGGGTDSISVTSNLSVKTEPTLDGVLDKIRHQQGSKNDWTEEKAKLLAKSR